MPPTAAIKSTPIGKRPEGTYSYDRGTGGKNSGSQNRPLYKFSPKTDGVGLLPSQVPGKNLPPAYLGAMQHLANLLNAANSECTMPRPRRGGVVFACPPIGHISKNHDKGRYEKCFHVGRICGELDNQE
jgi:hypothetical protein